MSNKALTVYLVGCSKRKREEATTAENMYQGALFKKARAYIESRDDLKSWYILSAKYGLLIPGESIRPYDQSLMTMCPEERDLWGARCRERFKELEGRYNPKGGLRIVLLCGEIYREAFKASQLYGLLPRVALSTPLQGLGIGEQMRWLAENTSHPFTTKR